MTPRQGEIWWAEASDKRRPVLVVTRTEAIPILATILCAPVTRTIREIPTEIALDRSHGMKVRCVASFDNLQPVSRTALTRRIGAIDHPRSRICAALDAIADC